MACMGIIMLCACSFSESAEKGSERTTTSAKSIRIGVLPIEECLPLFVAEHLGLLDSTAADVRLIRYKAFSECRQALAKGEVHGIVNDSACTFRFLTSKKARIRRISQLSDKVIAADSRGLSYSIALAIVDSLLRSKENVFIVQVEDFDVRTQMLITGNVDAAILPEPFATKAIEAGAVEINGIKNNEDGVKSKEEGIRGKWERLKSKAEGIKNNGKGIKSNDTRKPARSPARQSAEGTQETLKQETKSTVSESPLIMYKDATLEKKKSAAIAKVVGVALDSIRTFGKENYFYLMK